MSPALLDKRAALPESRPLTHLPKARQRRGVLDDVDAEDVTAVWTLQAFPSRVDASIAADQATVVPHEPVRVA